MKNFTRKFYRVLAKVACLLCIFRTETLFSQITDSIVTIYCTNTHGSSQGTGFVLGSNGLIVTAYHVVEDAKDISIRDSNFNELHRVFIEHIDPGKDVAILSASNSSALPGLKPSFGTIPKQASIQVAGSPRGLPKQILFGRVTSAGLIPSQMISAADGTPVFATNINIYPVDVTVYGGLSGAPVLLENGTVLGIYSGSYNEGRGIGWAIPIENASLLLGQPALHRDVRQLAGWPALTLMGASWVSLKRSYDHEFTPEHLAKLEILEGALRRLKGTWIGGNNLRINGYGAFYCESRNSDSREFSFNSIDTNKALLVGTFRRNYQIQSIFDSATPASLSMDVNALARACNSAVFNDEATTRGSAAINAKLYLSPGEISADSDNVTFPLTANITLCSGNLCTSDIYGETELDDVEVIDDRTVRVGKFILTKKASDD